MAEPLTIHAGAVLTDIEGTISDIAFVRNVLFPYARRALPGFIAAHGDEPPVREQLDAAAELGGIDPADTAAIVDQLQRWIDEDRKAPPLKALQGMIWRTGYSTGEFTSHLYDDAWQALAGWHQSGLPLYVYSSGSVEAQRLYFRYTAHGDLEGWFDGFFDTTVGAKTEAASYHAIVDRIGIPAADLVFFSDIVAELDAAAQAGIQTVQLDRGQAITGAVHPVIPNFFELALEPETRRSR